MTHDGELWRTSPARRATNRTRGKKPSYQEKRAKQTMHDAQRADEQVEQAATLHPREEASIFEHELLPLVEVDREGTCGDKRNSIISRPTR